MEGLTATENQIMEMICNLLTNDEIAMGLGMKVNTVRTHQQNIIVKLHVHRMTHAVALYMEEKLRREYAASAERSTA